MDPILKKSKYEGYINLAEEAKRVASTSRKWKGLSRCKKRKREFKDLPSDLAEEVLSRVPGTSLRRVRSTCKTWNTISRSKSFANKHLALESKFNMVVMKVDLNICLMSINLDDESSCIIKPRGKLVSLEPSDQIDMSHVFHCDGLLLCVSIDRTRVVVWNPYLGQTRWIDPTPSLFPLSSYKYVLGYDSNTKSHKILRVYSFFDSKIDFNIYDLNSSGSGWRALDFGTTQNWMTLNQNQCGGVVSLKGNAYWIVVDKDDNDDVFLVSFDFTTERFGPRLPLPQRLNSTYSDALSLSSVREEQLVLLYQRCDTFFLEILITTKTEPDAVSWSNKVFLQVEMKPLTGYFMFVAGSFFIDEEKKVAVVFDKGVPPKGLTSSSRNAAYILGVDGSLKIVDLGESPYSNFPPILVGPYAPTLPELN